jgi:hypothetical protein
MRIGKSVEIVKVIPGMRFSAVSPAVPKDSEVLASIHTFPMAPVSLKYIGSDGYTQ